MLYYWLFSNIALFYVLVAYGLSLWGAYICWEVDEEEALLRKAMKLQASRKFGNKQYIEKMRLAGWGPEEQGVSQSNIEL